MELVLLVGGPCDGVMTTVNHKLLGSPIGLASADWPSGTYVLSEAPASSYDKHRRGIWVESEAALESGAGPRRGDGLNTDREQLV